MPAVSQQQQKLFGLALSVKRGETPSSEASDDVLKIVNTMSEKDIEDFAGTEHKGLPTKVESKLRSIVREILKEKALSELEISKDDMDKLHSDGEAEIDGEKITYTESSVKIKTTISKKEWRKVPKFNKHIGQDGTHYLMKYDDKIGTHLVAVKVED